MSYRNPVPPRILTLALAAACLAPTLGSAEAQQVPRPRDPAKGGPPLKTEIQVPESLTTGNTRLATDLYGRLRQQEGNLFFSPYSISTALAMTFAGARGETAAEMARVLHLDLPPDELHPAFHALIRRINGEGGPEPRPYRLDTANALWGQRGDAFLDSFLNLTRANYGAGLRLVDFRNGSEPARLEINAWVEEQTRSKIKDLLAPGDVTPSTSLILTNAIYFKGDWLSPFDAMGTRKDGTFKAAGGRTIVVPLMSQTETFGYHDGGTFQLLQLPYAGGDLAMLVLLPKDVDGLPALEARLNAENLKEWGSRARPARVAVTLPKFTLTEQFRLADVLKSMGMTLAFSPGRADFSGMNGGRDLVISEVIHKAFVGVDEKGTEAAAATAVAMVRMSAVRPAPPIEFRADHPFVFLIQDKATGSVLFLGRLAEPRA